MKKTLFILFAFALFILAPIGVKADIHPVGVNGYSKHATIGSEIVFTLNGTQKFDGTITYNSNELELISHVVGANTDDDIAYPVGKISDVSKEAGKLVFKYVEAADGSNDSSKIIIFTFKVKAVSNSGKVTVTYTPNDSSVLYGTKSASQDYPVISNNCNSESTSTTVPETTEVPKDNSTTDTVTTETVKCEEPSKVTLYAPWALSGVLLVALIVVASKKKSI